MRGPAAVILVALSFAIVQGARGESAAQGGVSVGGLADAATTQVGSSPAAPVVDAADSVADAAGTVAPIEAVTEPVAQAQAPPITQATPPVPEAAQGAVETVSTGAQTASAVIEAPAEGTAAAASGSPVSTAAAAVDELAQPITNEAEGLAAIGSQPESPVASGDAPSPPGGAGSNDAAASGGGGGSGQAAEAGTGGGRGSPAPTASISGAPASLPETVTGIRGEAVRGSDASDVAKPAESRSLNLTAWQAMCWLLFYMAPVPPTVMAGFMTGVGSGADEPFAGGPNVGGDGSAPAVSFPGNAVHEWPAAAGGESILRDLIIPSGTLPLVLLGVLGLVALVLVGLASLPRRVFVGLAEPSTIDGVRIALLCAAAAVLAGVAVVSLLD